MFSADTRLGAAQPSKPFALNPSRLRFNHALAVLCGVLLTPLALADEAPTGRYGIYFGTHEHGRVQRSQEREEP